MNIHIAEREQTEAIFALRVEVFVKEQNVPPQLELDEEDEHALHIIAEEGGQTLGCARLIINGAEAHIGRLAVKKNFRGQGIGEAICRFVIDYSRSVGCTRIWLNSQLHARTFYQKLGFVPKGEIFLDAGIEHIEMEIMNKE